MRIIGAQIAYINKRDTNGVKPLLLEGEFGFDDYLAGGDEETLNSIQIVF